MQFLERQIQKFEIIFFLLGSYEPYHGNWAESRVVLNRFRESSDCRHQEENGIGQFIVLERTRYDISSEITILGCTLFSHVLNEQCEHVSFGLNDFLPHRRVVSGEA